MSVFRSLLRPAVLTASAAAMVIGVAAVPAQAENPTMSIEGPLELALPLPGSPGEADRTLSYFRYWSDGQSGIDRRLTDFTYKIDGSDLKGIAELDFSQLNTWSCKVLTPGLVAECATPGTSYPYVPQVPIKAAAGAKNGQSGTVKLTASATGTKVEGTETDVVVGGSDLTLEEVPDGRNLKIGSAISSDLEGANLGTLAVPGVIVSVANTTGLDAAERFSNCVYAVDKYRNVIEQAVCRIDTPVAIGEKYSIPGLYKFTVGADALHEFTSHGIEPFSQKAWDRATDWADFKPGTGRKLELVKKPAARSIAPDLDPYNNYGMTQYSVDSSADLAVPQVTAAGKQGEVVKAAVAVKNEGPGRQDTGIIDEPFARLKVEIPAGASVVKAPEDCHLLKGDETDMGDPLFPGHEKWDGPAYVCWVRGVAFAGEKIDLPFELRIDKVVPDAVGGLYMVPRGTGDKNPANNAAALVLNPTGKPLPNPGGPAIPLPLPNPGDNGPDLADTGGSSSTPLIAGIGGGLLLAAGGIFVVLRRRNAGGAAA
ncbi:LAETG motif-containing sortase-dependent surface protein [Yinghuangia soli]|uniref:LPXTG cell wall anchor domain-containing protein n=1 Tax=Yinghuangia soli TaxID=2908204 RepID=A0AA41Q0J5_9ACTN|nr:LAETG motif-containing sortase-dependent surface protein [Yinghuangia soli]MCF2529343.1 LPXTG cell wall anchor domain-containing protein [Yinghuangia soli]